jgi:hypothetical protein
MPLMTSLTVPTQANAAVIDALILEMAELVLAKHAKIAKADRAVFLQARLPHLKKKKLSTYKDLAQILAQPQATPLQLSDESMRGLNTLAQELAKDVEKNTQKHWTLTLLHRHYLKVIRLDQKAIQACEALQLNNQQIKDALAAQKTYLENLNQLLMQLETTLTALSQSTSNEDQFTKAPEILTGLVEKSLIGDEANASNNIKRFIFRALAPEVINPDTIPLSEEQAKTLSELAELVLTISKAQTKAQAARNTLSKNQTKALTQLGVTLRTPTQYITQGVIEPMKQTINNVTHTTRASQAAYRAIQRRRNVIDLMTNLTTVLDETNQLNGSLITAELIKEEPETGADTSYTSYFTSAAGMLGNALYQGFNTALSLGKQITAAIPNPLSIEKAPEKNLLNNQDDETTLAMAAFAKVINTFQLDTDESKQACLSAFCARLQTQFTLEDYKKNAETLGKTNSINLALQLREVRDLLLSSPDEKETNDAISIIIAAHQAINTINNEDHKAVLKKHLDDALFTLHECVLLPALYEMLDNETTMGTPKITLQRMINNIESRRSTPSRDDWKVLKNHEELKKLSLFKHRKQLPINTSNANEISVLDASHVKTPTQQTEAQIKTVIEASLPTLFNSIIAAIEAEKKAAQQLRRQLKKNKENAAYCAKLAKKNTLCDQLLLALESAKNTETSTLAKNLSRTLHGYTLNDANTHLQNNLASPFKLTNRLLITANHLAEMNGILATNNPLLSKCLNMLFSQCDLREATRAMNAFYNDDAPIDQEDALWFSDTLQDPLSVTTLPSTIMANTLTQSTNGIVSLLKLSASEAPGMIASKLLKLIPDLFPGMGIASLLVRQFLKSGIVSESIERMISEKADPEFIAKYIMSQFITNYGKEASINTPETLTTNVLLGTDKTELAEAHFAEFFFKFHRLCLLKEMAPKEMLAELDPRNEINDDARLKCISLHQAVYGAIQNTTMRAGLQSLITEENNYALILLLHRAKQQMNLALKQEAEGKSFADIQTLIEEAILSFEFLQTKKDKLNAAQNAMVATSLNTLTEKLTTKTADLLKETAALKQDSTLQLQKTRLDNKSFAARANAAKQNTPNLLFRIGKLAYSLFSIASFWYSSIIAPLFMSSTTAGGYFAHLVGFAAAGSSLLTTALGYLSFGVLIACFLGRFGYELFINQAQFRNVWDNKTDSIPMKVLKTAGYVGLAFSNALFKTVLSTFAVEAIKNLAKTAWNKISLLLHRKSMLKEIESLTTEFNALHQDVSMEKNKENLDSLQLKITALKNKLATSKHQADVLNPLKEKISQLETRMEKLNSTLARVPASSAAKIYEALNIHPAPEDNAGNEADITLQEVSEAKAKGKIRTYSEEPATAAVHEPKTMRRANS